MHHCNTLKKYLYIVIQYNFRYICDSVKYFI